MKNLGELSEHREPGRLKVSQQTYTVQLGETYGVKRGRSIPLPTTRVLWKFDVDEPNVGQPFLELIGSLLWVALLIE